MLPTNEPVQTDPNQLQEAIDRRMQGVIIQGNEIHKAIENHSLKDLKKFTQDEIVAYRVQGYTVLDLAVYYNYLDGFKEFLKYSAFRTTLVRATDGVRRKVLQANSSRPGFAQYFVELHKKIFDTIVGNNVDGLKQLKVDELAAWKVKDKTFLDVAAEQDFLEGIKIYLRLPPIRKALQGAVPDNAPASTHRTQSASTGSMTPTLSPNVPYQPQYPSSSSQQPVPMSESRGFLPSYIPFQEPISSPKTSIIDLTASSSESQIPTVPTQELSSSSSASASASSSASSSSSQSVLGNNQYSLPPVIVSSDGNLAPGVLEYEIKEFIESVISKQELSQLIGKREAEHNNRFIRRPCDAVISSFQTTLFLLYEVMKTKIPYTWGSVHITGLPVIEFETGIVVLPEIERPSVNALFKIESVIKAYKTNNKPIYFILREYIHELYRYSALVIVPGNNNTVQYRYISPFFDNENQWVDFPAGTSQTFISDFQKMLSLTFTGGVTVMRGFNYGPQPWRFRNDSALYTISNISYMLQKGSNAVLDHVNKNDEFTRLRKKYSKLLKCYLDKVDPNNNPPVSVSASNVSTSTVLSSNPTTPNPMELEEDSKSHSESMVTGSGLGTQTVVAGPPKTPRKINVFILNNGATIHHRHGVVVHHSKGNKNNLNNNAGVNNAGISVVSVSTSSVLSSTHNAMDIEKNTETSEAAPPMAPSKETQNGEDRKSHFEFMVTQSDDQRVVSGKKRKPCADPGTNSEETDTGKGSNKEEASTTPQSSVPSVEKDSDDDDSNDDLPLTEILKSMQVDKNSQEDSEEDEIIPEGSKSRQKDNNSLAACLEKASAELSSSGSQSNGMETDSPKPKKLGIPLLLNPPEYYSRTIGHSAKRVKKK